MTRREAALRRDVMDAVAFLVVRLDALRCAKCAAAPICLPWRPAKRKSGRFSSSAPKFRHARGAPSVGRPRSIGLHHERTHRSHLGVVCSRYKRSVAAKLLFRG